MTKKQSSSAPVESPGYLPVRIDMPVRKRPVAIFGAGTIVDDAHLPAYRLLGLTVAGIADLDRSKATAVADRFGIAPERVFASARDLIDTTPSDAVFDLATPPASFMQLLAALPDGRGVLMQKPMGESLAAAKQILALCREKHLTAAVNFQLRYAPTVLSANAMIAQGKIGRIQRVEMRMIYRGPDEQGRAVPSSLNSSRYQWEFLRNHPHGYFYYSFIHFLDLLRSYLGEPRMVTSSSESVPASLLARERKNIRLEFSGNRVATIRWLHDDEPRHQFTLTGETGRIRIVFPAHYPHTGPDRLQYSGEVEGEETFEPLAVKGAWFPEAFQGPMSAIQNRLENVSYPLPTNAVESMKTMLALDAVVQALKHGTAEVGRVSMAHARTE